MKKVLMLLLVGLILFLLGVSISTKLSTVWIIIGTLFAVVGGLLMGGSSYFLLRK